jgi:hypothetical protein
MIDGLLLSERNIYIEIFSHSGRCHCSSGFNHVGIISIKQKHKPAFRLFFTFFRYALQQSFCMHSESVCALNIPIYIHFFFKHEKRAYKMRAICMEKRSEFSLFYIFQTVAKPRSVAVEGWALPLWCHTHRI